MALKKRKVSLPTMTRVADVLPETLNEKDRTFEIVFTKGARVLRRGFFEDFFEELGLETENVRMARLESGTAPFIDSHGFGQRSGIDSVLGVIESAELIPGVEGRAKVRMSMRDSVAEIFQDIKDGIIRNVSVGYNTFSFEKVGEESGLPIFRAVDWEPVEVSAVSAGADPDSQIRSEGLAKHDCEILEPEENREAPKDGNPEQNQTEKPSETPKENKRENPKVELLENNSDNKPNDHRGADMTPEEIKAMQEKARAEGVEAENKRQLDIRSIVNKVGLKAEVADKLISEGTSIDAARTIVINTLADKDKETENQTRSTNVEVGDDLTRKSRIEGMTSALLHRFRPKAEETRDNGRVITLPGHELSESGREFAYFSLIDMARACLEANGVRTGMLPKHTIADMVLNNIRGVHSTSDFPEILANVANKTLRSGYLAAPVTWRPFTNEVFVSDFKEISRTNLGDAPQLEKLQEGSEVKRGSMSEAAEKYFVEEYARIIALSRKTIINDDLGAFTGIPERMGRRASDLESDIVWNIIKANAVLADTFALFSAQHGNLSGTPAAPSETGLAEARKLMRRQLGLDGAEISLTPIWLYVPPEHETVAEKLIASIVPDSSTNVSPFSSSGRTPLRLDVEPRLETGANGSTDAWYIMADRGQVDMVELARLEGTDGPQIQTRDGFDINGIEIKIMHDVGAKAIDFRGLFKNAGA